MKRIIYALLSLLIAFTALGDNSKSFDATYVATIGSIPDGVQKLTVWIPLPVSRGAQTVSDVKIESPYNWEKHVDKTFGNHYATTTIKNPKAGDLTVKVHFTATRREETMDHPFERAATKADLDRALEPNKLVTLSSRVRELADQITAGKTGPIEQAHAIYDYLVTNMTYDKVAPGWGHGDTERACDVKKGNCTDFHSLFMSLARAKGIPARFVIGFPLTASDGQVKGYHCWAEFYVKGRGWIPVDASDGSKLTDAKAREYLFGNLDPARVQFTVGRDLKLTPHTNEPLNFFIYPHAEANGVDIGTPTISLQFTPR
ncbi:MAG TPA: transglutaminase domain-containing protein [Thermoanaerobaculia bacterium]|jgi:transglutaminase-like putative cysteine protease|nr:transglutaminase domain-containing protein [Thermoanaerobaculia bacterium]